MILCIHNVYTHIVLHMHVLYVINVRIYGQQIASSLTQDFFTVEKPKPASGLEQDQCMQAP